MNGQGSGARGQGLAEAVDRVCEACGHWVPTENGGGLIGICKNPQSPARDKKCWGTGTCGCWKGQNRVCGLCDEWDYVGEDQERQIGTGLCKSLESPHFHQLMAAYDEGCEFFLEADA